MSYTATTAVRPPAGAESNWRSRVQQALRGAQAPRIVAALLGLALAIEVPQETAVLASLLRGPLPRVTSQHPPNAVAHRVSADTIVAAHLFGFPPALAAPQRGPAAQERSLVLTGTIAAEDPSVGYAFIGTAREHTRFYSAGTRTPEGALLLQVYSDHVIIERDGRRLSLSLPRQLDLHTLAMPDTAAANAPPPPPHEPTPDEMTATLQQESSRLSELLTETPYFLGDKLIGVRIEAGSSTELLRQLGLQPGDILKTVDGTLVTPERLDWLRTHLASGNPVRLSGTRPGQGQFNVTVNSSLVAGMIAP